MVRSDEEVSALVEADAQQQAQMQAMAVAQQGADMAKTASETEISEDDALGVTMQRAGLA